MRDNYKGYRMPKSIIGFAVRYYHRFKLSLRDISELLLDRGIKVTYETIRNWSKTWRPLFAKCLRKRRGSAFADKWHIDEVRLKIKGEVFCFGDLLIAREKRLRSFCKRGEMLRLLFAFLRRHYTKLDRSEEHTSELQSLMRI